MEGQDACSLIYIYIYIYICMYVYVLHYRVVWEVRIFVQLSVTCSHLSVVVPCPGMSISTALRLVG